MRRFQRSKKRTRQTLEKRTLNELNIKYKDFQNKDSRRLLKQLVDVKLKEMKGLKSIMKTESKRKREDDKEKKRLRRLRKSGRRLRRRVRKTRANLDNSLKQSTARTL